MIRSTSLVTPQVALTVNNVLKLLSVSVAVLFGLGAGSRNAASQDAGESVSIGGLRQDIQFLASDELRGRSVTDETIDVARDYLCDRMTEIGLDMTSVSGKPFQRVGIPIGSDIRELEKNFVAIQLGGEQIKATVDDGFGPLAVGKNQATANGRIVFAGYGITSKELGYDDYESIDASGAVVILIRKEPGASNPNSPFDGVRNTRHAYFQTKIANAVRHGAIAVLIVNDPASVRDSVLEVQNRIDDEAKRMQRLEQVLDELPDEAVKNRAATKDKIAGAARLIKAGEAELRSAQRGVLSIAQAGTESKQTGKIPVVSIARDIADQILKQSSDISLADIEKQIDSTFQPASRVLPDITTTVSVDLKPAIAQSDNVIGRLPGKGALAGETIVIGAHYDHVGMGGYASLAPGTIAVHNGADDNASGTAAMLACASVLSKRLASETSHRTVLFIAFTGEERGLVGSQHYVDHPLLPIETTAAMVNLDMVGRIRDNELSVHGTGSASRLDAIVEQVNGRFGFQLFKVSSGYGPSDHQSFYRAGVPVLFFFTGLHNDYHRPSDDVQHIDFDQLARITEMVSEVGLSLTVTEQRPQYYQTDPRVQMRRQMTTYLGLQLTERGGSVTVKGVTEGGPAADAGLRPGDRLHTLGNKSIGRLSDVLNWLRQHSPGDSFEFQVIREAALMTLRGKLGKRP